MAHLNTNALSPKGVHPAVAALGMLLTLAAGYLVGSYKPWNFFSPGAGIEDEQGPVRAAAPPSGVARFKATLGTSPQRGAKEAKVTIVAFSDYQCPFCSRAENTVDALLTMYPKDVRVVFKHNPLPFHPNAKPATYAAMAVREQGEDAFWKFHALLFQNQTQLSETNYQKWVTQLGLNVETFKKDLVQNRAKYEQQVQADQMLARQVDASGTPNFFINGRQLVGARKIEEFQKIIDEEIQIANKSLAAGASYKNLYATLLQNAAQPAPAQRADRPPMAPAEFQIPKTVFKVPVGDAPVKGASNAEITMVLYSDFECPYCSKVEPIVTELRKQYGNKIRVAFKHNPLPFHPNAQLAAEATLAAHQQGKFWEMHDQLFANQSKLDRASLESYAQTLGLNMKQFRTALDTHAFAEAIKQDQAEAARFGASGTPSLFVNGRFLRGAMPVENFKKVIDAELAGIEQRKKDGQPIIYEALVQNGLDKAETRQMAPAEAGVRKVAVGDAPVKGPAQAKVTVIAFSDFQCPFCSKVVDTLKEIEKTYPRDVRIVFKQNPLNFHEYAMGAAEASLAAHEQGKFWEMHDTLFAHQQQLSRTDLEKYAQEIGLDMNRFRAALNQGTWKSRVMQDMVEGRQAGIQGTPGFLINGHPLSGAQPVERFKAEIDQALQEAKQLMKNKKIPATAVYSELMKTAKP